MVTCGHLRPPPLPVPYGKGSCCVVECCMKWSPAANALPVTLLLVLALHSSRPAPCYLPLLLPSQACHAEAKQMPLELDSAAAGAALPASSC